MMSRGVSALLVILCLGSSSGATIVCNGDSNTRSDWQGFPNGTADGWCDRIGGINRGVGGSTIVDTGIFYYIPSWGGFYIDRELAGVDPFVPTMFGQPYFDPFPRVDTLVMAFGTNDLRGGWTPRQVIAAYRKYRRHVIAAGGVPYVATTPPVFNPDCTLSTFDVAIRSLNQKIRKSWPRGYVEFYNGFTCADFANDGLHLNATGQAKRAAAASAVLP